MAALQQLCQPVDMANMWAGWNSLSVYEQGSLINVASQKVLDNLRRGIITLTGYDEFYDGHNQPRIFLKHVPVVQVTAINVNGFPLDNTYLDAWSFDGPTGALYRGQNLDDARFHPWFPAGLGNVEVVYAAGLNAIPDPVIRATAWMVKFIHERGKLSGIYSAERIGDYNYTLNAVTSSLTLPAHVADMLANYSRNDVFV